MHITPPESVPEAGRSMVQSPTLAVRPRSHSAAASPQSGTRWDPRIRTLERRIRTGPRPPTGRGGTSHSGFLTISITAPYGDMPFLRQVAANVSGRENTSRPPGRRDVVAHVAPYRDVVADGQPGIVVLRRHVMERQKGERVRNGAGQAGLQSAVRERRRYGADLPGQTHRGGRILRLHILIRR